MTVPPAARPPVPTTEADVPPDEPRIRPADAEDLCAERYPTREEAMEVARRLRAAGWVVVELDGSRPRPGGTRVVASVYHPVTYESPGDVLVAGSGHESSRAAPPTGPQAGS